MDQDLTHAARGSGEFHDVLVMNDEGKLFRFPVRRATQPRPGEYRDSSEDLGFQVPGGRKVEQIAARSAGPVAAGSGPAFATIPIKPDPGSSNGTCFLVNAQNVREMNPWTAAEWNEDPGCQRLPGQWGNEGFEILLAGPQGRVFHLTVDWSQPTKQDKPAVSLERINLKHATEIWQQLRDGLVAGAVPFRESLDKAPRQVPIVNITSLRAEGE